MRLLAVLSFVGAAAAFQQTPRRRPIMQHTTGYEPQLPADVEQRTLDLHAYLQKQWWPQGGAPSMPELRALRLFDDEFISLVAEDHPIGDGPFDIETYAASRHVLTAPLGNADASYLSKRLEASGLTRRVALSVPHFSVGPTVLAGSDLVLTIPKRLAEHYATVFGHRMVPLAFDVPPISVFLTWHERQHRDPAHRWLRQCLRETFQEA